jgi:hypothetical protein
MTTLNAASTPSSAIFIHPRMTQRQVIKTLSHHGKKLIWVRRKQETR